MGSDVLDGVFYKTTYAAQLAGAGGCSRRVLAPILLSAISIPLDGHYFAGPPFAQGPIYSANVSPAAPGSNSVTVAAALVPQWSQ